jgi:hypothetical protein
VTAITNYLNELRNDDEPAKVKRKQSSTLPMWAVIIFGLIIVMGVLGIYLQPDPEPARPERHQGQMGMQLLCCFLEWAAVSICQWLLDSVQSTLGPVWTVAVLAIIDLFYQVFHGCDGVWANLLHTPEARAELARLRAE